MKKLTGLLFLLTVLLLSCHNKAELDANGIPGKLMIAIYVGGDNPNATKAASTVIQKYFEKKLGMDVEFVYATDYTAIIEAIRAKKAHVAYLTPFSYILASQTHDITPIVTLGENGKAHMYHSVIFTNYHTNLNSMDDVKARAKTLSLCFADPASTSGHLIPAAYLSSIGLDPDNAFKSTIFAGSHPASVLSVASGKSDIGCSTKEYGIDLLLRRGVLKPGLVKVLWTSDPIVSAPIVVRNDLNKDFAKKIQNLYLHMAKDAPDVFAAYVKLYYPHPEKLSYVPVSDTLYNGLRKIAKSIKDLNIAN
jgi:phosphonate transport system substrate-binding protein